MWDNGFSRAQASYDAQMPPDNTEDWEAYEDRYSTEENRTALVHNLFDRITDSMTPKEVVRLSKSINLLLEKGLDNCDVEDVSHLFSVFDIAPSFESFLDSRADDGPDPDVGRDD